MKLRELKGANIDVDLTSDETLTWKQDVCPCVVLLSPILNQCSNTVITQPDLRYHRPGCFVIIATEQPTSSHGGMSWTTGNFQGPSSPASPWPG